MSDHYGDSTLYGTITLGKSLLETEYRLPFRRGLVGQAIVAISGGLTEFATLSASPFNFASREYVNNAISFLTSGASFTFTTLLDTPNSYAGQQGKFIVVNSSENGLDFTSIDTSIYALQSETQSLSANITALSNALSAYTLQSTTENISSNLQDQIDILTLSIPTSSTFLNDYDNRFVNITGDSIVGSLSISQNLTISSLAGSNSDVIVTRNTAGKLQSSGTRLSSLATNSTVASVSATLLTGITNMGNWAVDQAKVYTDSVSASLTPRITNLENTYATKSSPTSGVFNTVIVNNQGIVISGGNIAYTSGDLADYTLLTTTSNLTAGLNLRLSSVENTYATKSSPTSGVFNTVIVNNQGIVISGGNISYENLSNYTLLTTTSSISSNLNTKINNIVIPITDFGASLQSLDNTTAIQNAINYVANLSGGVVYIPPGIWYSGQIKLKTKVTLQGCSRTASTLKSIVGLNTHFITIDSPQEYWYGIKDLTIDGNNYSCLDGVHLSHTQTITAGGPNVDSPNCEFMNVFVTQTSGNGWTIGLYGMGGHSAYNLVAYDTKDAGFFIGSPDSYYYNCVSAKTKSYGFEIRSSNNLFSGCKAFLAGTGYAPEGDGFFIRADRNQLVGCIGQDNYRYGLYNSGASGGTADRTIITNFTADSNNANKYSYGAGIAFEDCSYVFFNGVSYNRSGYDTNQKYGVLVNNVTKGVKYCDISCTISNCASGALNNYYSDFLKYNSFKTLGTIVYNNQIGPFTIPQISGSGIEFTVNGNAQINGISGTNNAIVTHDSSGKILDSGVLIASLTTLSETQSISSSLNNRVTNLEINTLNITGGLNQLDNRYLSISNLLSIPTPTTSGVKGSCGYISGYLYYWTDSSQVVRTVVETTW